MRDIFIIMFMVGIVPAILRWPFLGILGWCVVSYMNPHQLGWGRVNDLPFGMLIGLATIFSFMISSGYRKTVPLTPITVLLLVFFGYMTMTTIMALAPGSAYEKWDKVFKVLLMTFITIPMMASRERIHAFVWVIVLCIGFYGVKGGLFTLINGGGYRVWGPPNTMIEDNNHLALALIMLLPMVRYLHLQSGDVWIRRGLLLAMALIGASIIGSYSRGAFVAGSACLFWLFLKSRHKMAIIGLGVFALILGLSVMPPEWMARMATIQSYTEDSSVQGRFDAWTFAWRLAQMRPLFGGGFNPIDSGLFLALVPDGEVARAFHSNYFEVLGEHGFIGLALFLAILAAGFFTAGSITRQVRHAPGYEWARDLASMVQVSLVAYAVGGLFLNMATFDLFYHILVILVMLRLVIEGDAVATPKPATLAEQARASRRPPQGVPTPASPGGSPMRPQRGHGGS
ncbi:hypothetical protein C882_1591 [Caenispirillum salinarum AK4]|uniref:O-glycosylation ligase, exosortase A system-associated n=1 Tax=Caenispirillum salinarum AK4 TaxID=1238182 RepID=K9HR56_9PROT|nr:putative O-glycosylation ligase, exosortase A system-associated [Caenispirillum salinarum]EKV32753.1 hypothetical protein C882_1591 [Caenispirillum salinarum AK4]